MEFTYEKNDTQNTLETYEWDNIWWEHAEDTTAPRILAIGDSISCGWRITLNEYYAGARYVDGFGTSKALDNPYLLPSVKLMASQMSQCDTVLFNNGLHGFHLSLDDYREHYRKVLTALKESYPKQKIFVLLTTPVREGEELAKRTEIVIERNFAAIDVAESLELPIIDLFTPLLDKPALYSEDGVHLTQEGYKLLATTIAENIA